MKLFRRNFFQQRITICLIQLTFLLCALLIVSGLNAQSLNTQGSLCAGNSATLYVQPSGTCTTFTVSGSSSWSVGGAPSSVSYFNNYAQIHVTWNNPGTYYVSVSTSCGSVGTNVVITQNVTPTASLGVSPSAPCQGSNVTLSAGGTNGGSPYYTFYVDGSQVQSGASSSYSTNGLSAGSHSAYVVMSSSLSCVTSTTATSLTQNFSVTAQVSYTANLTGPAIVCASDQKGQFFANPSVTYGTPTYHWYQGGSPVGTNSSIYNATGLLQGQSVYCVISTDYSGCITSTQVQSNTYTVNLSSGVTPAVGVQIGYLSYCQGTNIPLTATGTNISGSPSYTWYVNNSQLGSPSTSNTTTWTPASAGSYTVSVNVSGISGTCLSTTYASGSTPPVTVSTPTVPGTLSTSVTSVCGSGSVTLSVNGNNGAIDRYMYQTRDNGGAWSLWTGATSNLTIGTGAGINRDYNFQAFVVNGGCPEKATPIVLTTAYYSPSIGTLSSSAPLVCSNSGGVTLSLTSLSATSVTWGSQISDDGGYSFYTPSPANFSTANALSQPFTMTGNGSLRIYNFQVTASNGSCTSAISNALPVKISAVPSVLTTDQTMFSPATTSIALSSTVPNTTFSFTPQTSSNVTIAGPGDGSGSGATIADQLASTDGLNPGTQPFSVTLVANGCLGNPVTVNALVYPKPSITSSSTRLALGPVTLNAQSFYDTYTWTNSQGQTVSTASSYQVTTPDSYTLTVAKNSQVATTAPYTISGQFDGQSANYIITNSLLVGNASGTTFESLPVTSVAQTIQYFDGLGKSLQTVVTKGSPSQADMVQPFVYDQYGRESRKYLPFTYLSPTPGWLNTNIFDANNNYTNAAANFYNSSSSRIATDSRYVSETVYEPSPLNRPSQQIGPGQNWKDNNKSVNHQYLVNNTSEVLLFTYDQVTGLVAAGTSSQLKYYDAGQLTANVTTDEQGNDVIEYTDKLGHKVCKKVQSGSNANGKTYATTYYIYNDLGNLAVVLPPEASAKFAPSQQ